LAGLRLLALKAAASRQATFLLYLEIGRLEPLD